MHAISSYSGNRHRPPARHKHRPPAVRPPQTGPITIHCTARLSAQCNNEKKTYETEDHKHSSAWALPYKGVLRGVFLANHLASTDNLTSNNQDTEHTGPLTQQSKPGIYLRESLISDT